MKTLSIAIGVVSVIVLSGCVDGRGYQDRAFYVGVNNRSCGNGENDVSHPYAGICDWRRENGRDWADSGANNNIYRRNR
ncbi:hypothetical protein [Agrobacterium larrymoorei]|uniref:hypothetical protein n=1 Tax=Agrobacterium larrymoorei TaxID=160699 RepID=UPI0030BF3C9F